MDLALARRGDETMVFVDGEKILTLGSAGAPSRPGLAIFRGAATFTDVRYRKLPRASPR